MCGISGMIKEHIDELDIDCLKQMNTLIKHRGPDSEGIYIDTRMGLAHRRLSILDLTQEANQPFRSGDYILVFNGEIYNYLELKDQLNNYNYKTKSDTEVILAAYDKWGNKCVEHFEGMWSFILYDQKKSVVFCSRDRFGIKPFYYYKTKEGIYFASEIKQFTCLKGWKAEANIDRVKDFLLFEMFDYTEETMFKGVKQLLPGTNLEYNLKTHSYQLSSYYNIHENVNDSQRKNIKEELYNILRKSVKEHMQSDVTIGSCLSGGLDSSSIVMLVNGLKDETIKQEVISSCFENKRYDEQEYIDEVVKKADINIHKIYPDFNDLFKELDQITWHQDEPFGSTSIFAQWSVFKEAKNNHIKVMLDGQGADEVFCGYSGFYSAYLGELLRKGKLICYKNEVKSLKKYYNYTTNDIIKASVKYLIPNSIKARLKIKLDKGGFNWIDVNEKYYSEYLEKLYKQKIKDLRSYSFNQIALESLPKLLHYEDRDSMAFSIEARVPFLDKTLVEYVLGLPSDKKIYKSTTKYCLREAMEGILPDKVSARRDKMGFVTPEEVWIRENKALFRKEFKEACLRLEKLIDCNKALVWFDELVASNRKIDFTIWRVISAGYWVKVFDVKFE